MNNQSELLTLQPRQKTLRNILLCNQIIQTKVSERLILPRHVLFLKLINTVLMFRWSKR